MIINLPNQNLLEADVEGFAHQANCFCTMGSGIAYYIKEKYPELYEADRKTNRGDPAKLGTFSWAKLHDGKIGFNVYSQYEFGSAKRHTSYDAICDGLEGVKTHAKEIGLTSLGLPYNMGCVRGGGDWNIVSAIIDAIFLNDSIKLYICRYEP